MGVVTDESLITHDFDLAEYLFDSLQYITFIIHIEETLNIVVPDELLTAENLHSFNHFANAIEECVKSNRISVSTTYETV